MVNYQFKIEYSSGKFVNIFREIEGMNTYVFGNLVTDIKKNCPGFAHLTPQTIRIRFQDEDEDYINLTEEDSRNFEEMLQHSKFVEERNVRKIQLHISELDSPLPNEPVDKKRKIDTTKRKNVALGGLQPRSLKYQNVNKTSSSNSKPCPNANDNENTSSSEDDESSMTAVERYVYKAKKNVGSQKAKLEDQKDKRNEIIEKLEAARLLAGEPNAKVCGNCHLCLGHTQKKSTLKQCTDVFNCGQEKRHPGEVNERRLDQEITKQEKVVNEAEEELKRRESAVETVQKSKTKQVENCLLETCRGDYVNAAGNLNWNRVRKHSLLIESYCKKDAIPDILKKACEEYEGKCGQSIRRAKTKGNPVKKTLQGHGIVFPSTSQRDSESEDEEFWEKPESKVTKQSDIARAIPSNTDEEKSQLEPSGQLAKQYTK